MRRGSANATAFLSTPSARRATTPAVTRPEVRIFLSTPSARRATVRPVEVVAPIRISIHALREEGDYPTAGRRNQMRHFYPRPPRGGRRKAGRRGRYRSGISIHALREEGDKLRWTACLWSGDFYPRPPRGGRPGRNTAPGRPSDFYPRPPRGGRLERQRKKRSLEQFLSTPSARRATNPLHHANVSTVISIHALREEGDTAKPPRL